MRNDKIVPSCNGTVALDEQLISLLGSLAITVVFCSACEREARHRIKYSGPDVPSYSERLSSSYSFFFYIGFHWSN